MFRKIAIAGIAAMIPLAASNADSDYSVHYEIDNPTYVGAKFEFDFGQDAVLVYGSITGESGGDFPVHGSCSHNEQDSLVCLIDMGWGFSAFAGILEGGLGAISFNALEEEPVYWDITPILIVEGTKRWFHSGGGGLTMDSEGAEDEIGPPPGCGVSNFVWEKGYSYIYIGGEVTPSSPGKDVEVTVTISAGSRTYERSVLADLDALSKFRTSDVDFWIRYPEGVSRGDVTNVAFVSCAIL